MSTERNLLAASAASREAHGLIKKHLNSKELTAQAAVVMRAIDAYYEKDAAATACDMEVLTEAVLLSVTNPKHKEAFTTIMGALAEAEVSPANVADLVMSAKREVVAGQLAVALSAGKYDEAKELLPEYMDLESDKGDASDDAEEAMINGQSLDDLLSTTALGGERIHIYPSSLDQRLGGGCMRGQHILLYARPEVGKTMMLVNMIYGFLRQGLRTLYIGNEEPVVSTAMRVMTRLCDRPYSEVMANKEAAMEVAVERGWNNLYMKYLSPGTPREIEELVISTSADVLLVDQLRNIQMKEDNLTRSLEKSGNAIRQLAGRNKCLAVSVTQAGETAEGKSILGMTDVDSSKTGLPAAFDVMVGVGMSAEDERAGRRVLSLPKNKQTGDHGSFPVKVDPILSKVSGLG